MFTLSLPFFMQKSNYHRIAESNTNSRGDDNAEGSFCFREDRLVWSSAMYLLRIHQWTYMQTHCTLGTVETKEETSGDSTCSVREGGPTSRVTITWETILN